MERKFKKTADSLCCSTETNTTLQSNYTPIKINLNFFLIFKKYIPPPKTIIVRKMVLLCILTNLYVWLSRKQLDSHIWLCIQSVMTCGISWNMRIQLHTWICLWGWKTKTLWNTPEIVWETPENPGPWFENQVSYS